MVDQHKIAVLLSRLVDLLRRNPDAMDEQKAALRSLVQITDQRSVTIRVIGNTLNIEGVAIPTDLPLVSMFAAQLDLHTIGAIQIGFGASAVDLMALARALAGDRNSNDAGDTVERRLRDAQVAEVFVVGAGLDKVAKERRAVRISDAVERPDLAKALRPGATDGRVVSTPERPEYGQMMDSVQASSLSLPAAIGLLRSQPDSPGAPQVLAVVLSGIREAMQGNRLEIAVDGLSTMIQCEAQLPEGAMRKNYSLALARILTDDALRPLAKFVQDPLYARDVGLVMERAGSLGTQHLLQALVNAPTFAERKVILETLRRMKDGAEMVVTMLRQPDWFVVRNVSDLAGELRLEEAVPQLGKLIEHKDGRVRKSAALALIKISTSACAQHIVKAIRDPDPQVRVALAKAIGGKMFSGLAMPLLSAAEAEEDPAIQLEQYRALGRIGTPDAVDGLKRVAEPGGLIVGRRAAGPRLAALEGLGIAGGDVAINTVRGLTQDRDTDVRKAAQKVLEVAVSRGRPSSTNV